MLLHNVLGDIGHAVNVHSQRRVVSTFYCIRHFCQLLVVNFSHMAYQAMQCIALPHRTALSMSEYLRWPSAFALATLEMLGGLVLDQNALIVKLFFAEVAERLRFDCFRPLLLFPHLWTA